MYFPKNKNKQPLNTPFIEAVDAFMQATKNPFGVDNAPRWVDGREMGKGELTIKIPLEVNGEFGDQKLIISACPNSSNLTFCILITFVPAICRLDYDNTVNHMNSHCIGTDDIATIIHGPHYHSWELNKRFFTHSSKPIELHNAVPLDHSIRNFDSALRWFCDENKIILRHDHRIEYPEKTLLL